MRSLLLIVLLVLVTLTSCDAFNLKQPAYVRFSWRMVNQNTSGAYLTSGYFHLNKLEFWGDREEGPEVNMEQSIDESKISFNNGSNLGFSLDIPAGRYEHMKITLEPNGHYEPCMVLMGSYHSNEQEIPFRIEWHTAKDLLFDPLKDQIVTKKKTYGVTFGFDEQQLFQSVDWTEVSTDTIDGGVMAIISPTKNVAAFEAIQTAMENAFSMTIEQL